MGMTPAQELEQILNNIEGGLLLGEIAGTIERDSHFGKDVRRAHQLSKLLLREDHERDTDD